MTLDAVALGSLPGGRERRQSLMVGGQKSVPGCEVLSNSRKNMADPNVGLPEPKDL